MEVDGAGHLYISSWEGATFTYNGPNAGYLVRLSPKGGTPPQVPRFETLTPAELVGHIGSPSGVWRLAAQRELLKRQPSQVIAELLHGLAASTTNPGARTAAVFTLRLIFGAEAQPHLIALAGDPSNSELRAVALKALADDLRLVASVPVKPFVTALNDPEPRVRLQAITGLGRLGKREAAAALLPHTADADPVVSHIAVQSLRSLQAAEVCLAALDAPIDSPERPKIQRGALRVLQALHDPAVVQGLISRLGTDNAALRLGIFQTLCRLDTREAAYTGIKQWWGTRPDTSGPIYQPERWAESDTIEKALRARLAASSGDEARQQVASLIRTKVSFPGMTDEILAKAGNDTSARMDVIASLLSPKTPASPELVRALSTIASSSQELPAARARALRLLAGLIEKSRSAVLDAFQVIAPVNPHRADAPPMDGTLAAVWEEFTRDLRHASAVGAFAKLSQDADPARRVLGTTVLTHLATSPVLKDERRRGEATNALVRLWKNPETTVTLLGVIGRTRAGGFGSEIESRVADANPEIAAAARYARQRLAEDSGSGTAATTIASLAFKDVVERAVAAKGDAAVGRDLFLKQGCSVCHTLSSKEPPKGPMLGGIATRYSRAELCESILKPSAKIAQGFESQSFTLRNGDQVDGFVVKEGGDSVEVRNLVGTSTVIEKGDIAERHKLEQSIMPEGLVANLTPGELASLLAFLESTAAK
jgi:putative heme-binding domain-containing protein